MTGAKIGFLFGKTAAFTENTSASNLDADVSFQKKCPENICQEGLQEKADGESDAADPI